MSNYTKSTNFASKDALASGNPLKIVKGTEIDTEFNNIAIAITTKTDNASAVITGGSIDNVVIGGSTAAAGSFTNLSASGTVSGSGFSTYLASPPAIGGTTANTGKFSALTNTALTAGRVIYSTTGGAETDSANLTFDGTTLTSAGFAGPHNGTVGAGTPNTGAFTTLSASGNITVSGGTANGIAYLNGSKVLTTGSAFSFDGTTQTLANASNTANTYNGINFTTAYTPTGVTNTNTDALVSFYGLDQNGVSGTYAGIKASHLTNSAVKSSSVGYLRLDTNQLSSGVVSANTNSYLQLVGGGASTLSSVGNLTLNAGVATGTGAKIIFNAEDGTEKMRLTVNGLGIGTTTPGSLLDVNGTANFASTVTFTGGTANGVGYLNGSKQFTAGSGLTFDGTSNFNFGISNASTYNTFGVNNLASNGYARMLFNIGASGANGVAAIKYAPGIFFAIGTDSDSSSTPIVFNLGNATEQMRLTSTGLGIGTSSPRGKLDVTGGNAYIGASAATTILAIGGNTSTTGAFIYEDNNQMIISQVTSGPITFRTANTDRAVLDSSGNLGLGVTPGSGLTVGGGSFSAKGVITSSGPLSNYQTSMGVLEFNSNKTSIRSFGATAGTGYIAFNVGGGGGSADTQAMTLDSSGNLGLGVTPSAWSGVNQVFEFGASGVSASLFQNGVNDTWFSSNAYFNGSFKYKATGTATQYYQGGGLHKWYTAPSGTAGTAISFTQAMTLDASGNLMVGTTSPTNILTIGGATGGIDFAGWNNNRVVLRQQFSSSYYQQVIFDASNRDFQIQSNSSDSTARISFWTGSSGTITERARIDSSGNLLVGTTATGGRVVLGVINTGTAIVYKWPTSGSSGGTAAYFEVNASNVGSIACSTVATLYNTTSDHRLKDVVGAVTGSGERIDALKPVNYTWKADGSAARGFLAHEFQEVYANSVTGTKDAVDEEGNPIYQQMQASTTEVIADLVAEIQSLRKRLAALEGK